MAKKRCSKCGKPLEAQTCGGCGGSGEIRQHLFFKKTCDTCNGRGVVFRCPDWISHITWPSMETLTSPRITFPSSKTTVRKCPLGHPLNDQGICPTCVGGYISQERARDFAAGRPFKR